MSEVADEQDIKLYWMTFVFAKIQEGTLSLHRESQILSKPFNTKNCTK
jgi:beta-lactamase class A